ncbi:MAG TPA: ABC transporter ATP-binding protein [Hypericibacter adhaerens]|uniref:ABC transporter ATP-binding protein n=1 Tax=Hypericibacter adhaerens TaxID=2602016 RepID=UPI002C8804C9|nr:ABC transporter ATP-binding protein [Hypericibacter adhaerens]HWA42068.1 ABC transporter ATP-binding protein [Hypericibacter adhaerens]
MTTSGILLELQGVSKTYGAAKVLEEVDLAVRDGEFITILGPSGSGKTTILRMIGGFIPPSGGRILLEGKDIVALPINRRPFNTVFQDYALFPHMTVAANVGYGLRVRGEPKAEIGRRVKEALALVQLTEFADRYPSQLSGGQRQRVALARAIICQPRLILLDEPLAALDVALRRQMQEFLKEIQRQIRTTFLFVTHDQEEAIAMADRICVMNGGRILQLGTAHDVYYRPASEFVARFFGENNLIEGRLEESQGEWRWIATAIGRLRCAVDGQVELATAPLGRRAFAAFRPECVSAGTPAPDSNRVEGAVTQVSFGGASTSISLAVGEGGRVPLRLRWPSRAEGVSIQPGQRLSAHWRAADCRLVLA